MQTLPLSRRSLISAGPAAHYQQEFRKAFHRTPPELSLALSVPEGNMLDMFATDGTHLGILNTDTGQIYWDAALAIDSKGCG